MVELLLLPGFDIVSNEVHRVPAIVLRGVAVVHLRGVVAGAVDSQAMPLQQHPERTDAPVRQVLMADVVESIAGEHMVEVLELDYPDAVRV